MDHLHTRLEALEHRTHTLARQLRWWLGLAGGLLVLAGLTWAVPAVTAEDAKHDDKKGLAERVAALESLLKHFSRKGNEVFITGANLHIVNGLGQTDCGPEDEIPDCPNGLGNLIVGYNEPREFAENIHTGSHNVVVGREHNFSRFGGIVVGLANTISGEFAAVIGGSLNTASGELAVVTRGEVNAASGESAAVGGGQLNEAFSDSSSVSGGLEVGQETAFGWAAGLGGEKVVVGNFRSP